MDPAKRLDADKILAHTWVIGEKTPRKQLPNVTNKIREFNAKRKFRVTLNFVYLLSIETRYGCIGC